MACILAKLKEWIEYVEKYTEEDPFEPLRMTIIGAAGTGKSVIINTLVAVLRRMFQDNDVVHVAAPTGTAAFNVNGETMHRLFSILVDSSDANGKEMTEKTRKMLMQKFKNTVAILLDERSMVSLRCLGAASNHVATTAHGGCHDDEDWGGVPIVVLFGDDYQLPSIDRGPFDILVDTRSRLSKDELKGAEAFLECAEDVMVLSQAKRFLEDQQEFKEILCQARTSELSKTMATKLVDELSLHKNLEYTEEEKREIFDNALFISANKRPVEERNLRRLAELSSPDTPVAIIKSRTQSGKKMGKNSHFENNALSTAMMCAGAMVSVAGCNFQPSWGLHNGAIGKVQEIVFAPGQSPNSGDLPLYVAVEFESYCGPVWDKSNPKVVPIPTIPIHCKKMCCTREICPLQVAFAKTIDTFQGMNAGPVQEGRPPNPVKVIVCDPGNRSFEGTKPGLFFTMISRGTTIGHLEDGKRLDSAMYFYDFGYNTSITTTRIANLRCSPSTGKTYMNILKRDKWVDHLHKHVQKESMSPDDVESTLKWANETRVGKQELQKIVNDTTWRHKNTMLS